MSSNNMHYYYNVEYFQDTLLAPDASERFKRHNQYIYGFRFHDDSYRKQIMEEEQLKEVRKSFRLRTIYPGLWIGSGYSHEPGSEITDTTNAIIGGFYFDYVTGLPVIPGSTVKGMLRSYFHEDESERRTMVWELAEELTGGREMSLEKLEENLFEKKDVYIGGFPVINEGVGTQLLTSEYITPHKEQFKNPTPLSLLKVRPDVTYEFIFLLYDYVEDGRIIMTADQKKELYKKLLEMGGIGAKTNVGFGQFMS